MMKNTLRFLFLVTALVHLAWAAIIDYTVENLETEDDRQFTATLRFDTTERPFIEIMDMAAEIEETFRYTSESDEELGEYITSINGLHQDNPNRWYWGFTGRSSDGDCFQGVGVSTHIVSDGEHIVFQYVGWDLLLPPCGGNSTSY